MDSLTYKHIFIAVDPSVCMLQDFNLTNCCTENASEVGASLRASLKIPASTVKMGFPKIGVRLHAFSYPEFL